jgi:hypothetical protein
VRHAEGQQACPEKKPHGMGTPLVLPHDPVDHGIVVIGAHVCPDQTLYIRILSLSDAIIHKKALLLCLDELFKIFYLTLPGFTIVIIFIILLNH